MTSSPSISIIVPVYKVEPYLRQCIDSILAQTFANFELLLVDDGSPDKSGDICDEYAGTDNRIRVHHKQNEGVSAARNWGLDNARGEWVMFMDADDVWTTPDALSILIDNSDGADIIRGEYVAIDAHGEILFQRDYAWKTPFANKDLPADVFISEILKDEFFLWLCLIRRDLIGSKRFRVGMVFLEDMLLFMQLLCTNGIKCRYITNRFYGYRKTGHSASDSTSIRKLADSFAMCDEFDRLADESDNAGIRRFCHHSSVMRYYLSLQKLAEPHFYKDKQDIIRELGLDDLHCRTAKRIGSRSAYLKYLPFILPRPATGTTLLHIKDSMMIRIKKITG